MAIKFSFQANNGKLSGDNWKRVVTFQRRLKKLRQKLDGLGVEGILVSHMPNIYYLSGFSGSSGYLLVTLEEALLYVDFRYIKQAAQEAPLFEVIKVNGPGDFSPAAEFIAGKGIRKLVVEEAHMSLREFNQLKKSLRDTELVPLFNFLEEIRSLKEEEEIEFIARAARIADEALQDALPFFKPGMTEVEVALELEYRLRKRGSSRVPFDIIVASGGRSALPHGVASGKVIREGDLVVVDFGAVVGGYCSDQTRTFVLGAPTPKQQQVYRLVLEGQELALKALRPGIKGLEVDSLVRSYFQKHGFGGYFGHGLGHGVGLEVHEMPSLSPRGEELLQESMVFTVEPGIYIEGWGGIRLEDLVVLRSGGPQVLTGSSKEALRKPNLSRE